MMRIRLGLDDLDTMNVRFALSLTCNFLKFDEPDTSKRLKIKIGWLRIQPSQSCG